MKRASCICPLCDLMFSMNRYSASPIYWSMGSSISHLGRSEPGFHAHNLGRIDMYPHFSMPIVAGGWSIVPEAACELRFIPEASRRI